MFVKTLPEQLFKSIYDHCYDLFVRYNKKEDIGFDFNGIEIWLIIDSNNCYETLLSYYLSELEKKIFSLKYELDYSKFDKLRNFVTSHFWLREYSDKFVSKKDKLRQIYYPGLTQHEACEKALEEVKNEKCGKIFLKIDNHPGFVIKSE